MNDDKKCGNCKYAGKATSTVHGAYYECRRYPPMVEFAAGEDRFPVVADDEWCGEWQGEQAPLRIGDFVKCPERYGDSVFQITEFTTSNFVKIRSLINSDARVTVEPAELVRHEAPRVEFPK